MKKDTEYFPQLEDIDKAYKRLKSIVNHTPLMCNMNLSADYSANILLKREDLQIVRSYKLRGAYNKISSLREDELMNGVVCASAGNHAQGVAYSCQKLKIKGTIFMPIPTPKQKIRQVEMFGKEFVDIKLEGDTFDDCFRAADRFCQANQSAFIHPFDDPKVIEGQGTVALEILQDATVPIDYLFVPVGGGGLISGVLSVFKKRSPDTIIVGVEPAGAPSMKTSLDNKTNTALSKIDKFVDGAAVMRVGDHTFEICSRYLDEMVTVPEGKVCSVILKLYNQDAIVAEPAGVLSIAALDMYAEQIKGKNVVCIISGSNNDITRMEEIKERSLLYEGLKHYFIVRFPQRAGALREFVEQVLGPNDDITHFEYSKKNSREKGPAVIGIELKDRADFEPLVERMKERDFFEIYLNESPELFQYLV